MNFTPLSLSKKSAREPIAEFGGVKVFTAPWMPEDEWMFCTQEFIDSMDKFYDWIAFLERAVEDKNEIQKKTSSD